MLPIELSPRRVPDLMIGGWAERTAMSRKEFKGEAVLRQADSP